VTCDYLINKGITKDRVISAFAAKGYKLPQHHLERHLEKQQQWKEHQDSLAGQQPVASTSTYVQPAQEQPYRHGNNQNGIAQGKRVISPAIVTDTSRPPPPLQATTQHHRATSSLADAPSLMRLGPLLHTPPTSAPSLSTKRRRESQEFMHSTTASHSTLPPNSSSTSSSLASSTIQPETNLSKELKALKVELARKEAAAKEALKARKAVLAKQNAKRAENFIEGLLSETKVDLASSHSTGLHATSLPDSMPTEETTTNTAPTASKAGSAGVSDLEDYEVLESSKPASTESRETTSALSSTLPTPATAPSHRPEAPRRVSPNTSSVRPARHFRAVATDFEADPSHKLSNVPRWTEQLLELSRRNAGNADMLIDLSDSENDDSDDIYDGNKEEEVGGNWDTRDRQENNGRDDDNELRLAIKNSRMQDSLNHSGYYQVSSFASSSNNNIPYPSYSLNNLIRTSESGRSSPAPAPALPTPSSIPPPITTANVKRRTSPPHSVHSRSSTPSYMPRSAPALSLSYNAGGGSSNSFGNAELEAKQAEIKKMLERIKKLEGKKKMKKDLNGSIASKADPNSRESSALPEMVESGDLTERSNDDTKRKETIQAAKKTVSRLLDEQEQLVNSTDASGGAAIATRDGKVGDTAMIKDSLSVNAASSTAMMRRGSSSDEAMSISSCDE